MVKFSRNNKILFNDLKFYSNESYTTYRKSDECNNCQTVKTKVLKRKHNLLITCDELEKNLKINKN